MNKVKIFLLKLEATITAPAKAFKAKAPLASFITGRIITMLVLLFLLGFALFGLMELAPGDIVDQMMTQQLLTNTDNPGAKNSSAAMGGSGAQDKNFTTEQMDALRAELGLDKPFYVQYVKWLKRVIVNHDLGTSLISKAPVGFLIRSRLWNSVLLNLIALLPARSLFLKQSGNTPGRGRHLLCTFLPCLPGHPAFNFAAAFCVNHKSFPGNSIS